jgi:ABC-type transporter Mla subunit MlaD
VSEVFLDPSGRITIAIDLHQQLKLPANTRAVLTYTSVLGGRQINLVTDTTVLIGERRLVGERSRTTNQTNEFLQHLDTIPGTVLDIPQQIADATAKPRRKLDSLLRIYSVDGNGRALIASTQASIEKLKNNTAAVSAQLRGMQKTLPNQLKTYAQMSAEYRTKMPAYMAQLDSLNKTAEGLKNKNLDKTIRGATLKMDTFNQMAVSYRPTLQKADASIDKVAAQIQKIPENATYQKLVLADSVPKNLQKKIQSTQTTLKDIYTNPEKYRKIN